MRPQKSTVQLPCVLTAAHTHCANDRGTPGCRLPCTQFPHGRCCGLVKWNGKDQTFAEPAKEQVTGTYHKLFVSYLGRTGGNEWSKSQHIHVKSWWANISVYLEEVSYPLALVSNFWRQEIDVNIIYYVASTVGFTGPSSVQPSGSHVRELLIPTWRVRNTKQWSHKVSRVGLDGSSFGGRYGSFHSHIAEKLLLLPALVCICAWATFIFYLGVWV